MSDHHTKKEIKAMETVQLITTLLMYALHYADRSTKANRRCLAWLLDETLSRTATPHTKEMIEDIIYTY